MSRESITYVGLDEEAQTVTAAGRLPGYDGWVVLQTFRARDGALDLIELRLCFVGWIQDRQDLDAWCEVKVAETIRGEAVPQVPGGGITTRMMRSIRWSELQAAARKLLLDDVLVPKVMGDRWRRATGRAWTGDRDKDREYAALAAAYCQNLDAPKAVERLAESMGPRGPSSVTVRSRLAEARRRGLLTSPGQGKQGGQLTPKAVALLREES